MKSKDLFARIEVGTLVLAILLGPGTYIIQVPAIDNYFSYRNEGGEHSPIVPLYYDFSANEQHDSIYINDNSDFEVLGFPGTGLEDDPYILEGYNITSSFNTAIKIQGTDVYFRVSNNWINGLTSTNNGISLIGVVNGYISNNMVINSSNAGIYLQASSYSTIINNTVYSHGTAGIELFTSMNNSVIDNISYENGWDGIRVTVSGGNTVSGNTAYSNSWKGIRVESQANGNTIFENTVYDNNEDGIAIISSQNNKVESNTVFGLTERSSSGIALHTNALFNFVAYNHIYDTGSAMWLGWGSNGNTIYHNYIVGTQGGIGLLEVEENLIYHNFISEVIYEGMFIESANNNTIIENEIYYNIGKGIFLVSQSEHNIITLNVIHDNFENGVTIETFSNNNIIEKNDFVNNMYEFAEIWDDGSNTKINNNYYHDWSGDGNYEIDGDAGNQDSSPSINANHISNIEISAEPSLQNSNIIELSWSNTSDAFHVVTYSLFYSVDDGAMWNLIVSEYNELSYSFNSNTVLPNEKLIFKMQVTDEFDYVSEFVGVGVHGTPDSSFGKTITKVDSQEPNESEKLSLPYNFVVSLIGLITLTFIARKRKTRDNSI